MKYGIILKFMDIPVLFRLKGALEKVRPRSEIFGRNRESDAARIVEASKCDRWSDALERRLHEDLR